MRIHIVHNTVYRYDVPPISVIQTLHVTPRNHEGQYVVRWNIDLSEDSRLEEHEDAFGNIAHTFTAERPKQLTVAVEGEIETQDMQGVVHGALERFPPSVFLRTTALTEPGPEIRDFARRAQAAAADGDRLNLLHLLLCHVRGHFAFDTDPTHTGTTAAEAFALKRGVCQDLTHTFIAAARSLGVPARYVGGYLHRSDGVVAQEAGHAWAEAFVPDLGWVAFDPTNGISATDAHIRVAVGLDYLGAAPIRGARYGGASEEMHVAVRVDQAAGQMQS